MGERKRQTDGFNSKGSEGGRIRRGEREGEMGTD